MKLKEDNTGFVYFPNPGRGITKLDTGKTFIYLVAFDPTDLSGKAYSLSNNHLFMPGNFVGDDIHNRQFNPSSQLSIDELIEDGMKQDQLDSVYFPNFKGSDEFRRIMSIPLTTSICIGWSEATFELKQEIGYWQATFKDLTPEGKKLYYSIKKLHNTKEVRILTFNNI
jgi:hypothetical protein